MSGPLDQRASDWVNDGQMGIEVREGRRADVMGYDVVRVLPTKGRRTVGAWCFADIMTPPETENPHPLEIGAHPHIGLATATWLITGEVLHSDSLGTEQLIRPGQLNLMTAGKGIAHAEQSVSADVLGVQMWIAQPERTRHGGSAFEHHGELPRWEWSGGEATILAGGLAGVESPARTDSSLVGAELRLHAGVGEIPLVSSFEYGVVPIDHPIKIDEAIVEPGWLGLIDPGRESVRLDGGPQGATVMLLGGEPLGERIQMWWNFVARTKDEITQAWRAWQEHDTARFAPVPSRLSRIDAPRPPWLRQD